MLSSSEEFEITKGLGLIGGTCKRFPLELDGKILKVPQINWNTVYPPNQGQLFKPGTILDSIKMNSYMYFVHSYYAVLEDSDEVLTSTFYGGISYCSSFSKGNIYGCQFHPEKSGKIGLRIYENFKKIIQKNCENRK